MQETTTLQPIVLDCSNLRSERQKINNLSTLNALIEANYELLKKNSNEKEIERVLIELDMSIENVFDKCKEYRITSKIPQDELVILLTDIGNEYNWFGSIDADMRNVFIHTSDWNYYFQGLHERFPITYEIISWLFRIIMFDNRLEIKTSMFCSNAIRLALSVASI
jgi:hypothetical protein